MDEYTIDLFNPPQEMAEHETNIPKLATTPPTPSQQDADTSDWPLLTGSKGLRDRVASLGRTTLQDRLVEKYVHPLHSYQEFVLLYQLPVTTLIERQPHEIPNNSKS